MTRVSTRAQASAESVAVTRKVLTIPQGYEALLLTPEDLAFVRGLLAAKPAPKAKAKAAPKPRKPRAKATHGAGVTTEMVNTYRELWHERVALRKTLALTAPAGTTAFLNDEKSTNKRMKTIVKQMNQLVEQGVNSYIVGW